MHTLLYNIWIYHVLHTSTHVHAHAHAHARARALIFMCKHTHTRTHTHTCTLIYTSINSFRGMSDSCLCVSWLVLMFDTTPSYVRHYSLLCMERKRLYHKLIAYVSYVWHDSFTCATRLIIMCDVSHSHVCQWRKHLLRMFGPELIRITELMNLWIKIARSVVSKNRAERGFYTTLVARRRKHFRVFPAIFLVAQLSPKRGV